MLVGQPIIDLIIAVMAGMGVVTAALLLLIMATSILVTRLMLAIDLVIMINSQDITFINATKVNTRLASKQQVKRDLKTAIKPTR